MFGFGKLGYKTAIQAAAAAFGFLLYCMIILIMGICISVLVQYFALTDNLFLRDYGNLFALAVNLKERASETIKKVRPVCIWVSIYHAVLVNQEFIGP